MTKVLFSRVELTKEVAEKALKETPFVYLYWIFLFAYTIYTNPSIASISILQILQLALLLLIPILFFIGFKNKNYTLLYICGVLFVSNVIMHILVNNNANTIIFSAAFIGLFAITRIVQLLKYLQTNN